MILLHDEATSPNGPVSSLPSQLHAASSTVTVTSINRPSRASTKRIWNISSTVVWTNPFTILSLSALFCVFVFILSVIDRNILTVLYPVSSALTFIHHIAIAVVYLTRGGRLYFSGSEAPGLFISISNLVALICLTIIWGGSSIFGAILASYNTDHRPPGTPIPIFTGEPALYPRLVICAVLGFLEAAVMLFLVLQFVMQRRNGVELARKSNAKSEDIPMSIA